jgi:response regulator RpfG family c-di-GMP phosphodiesterase
MDGLQFTKLIKVTQNTWRGSLKKDENINRALKIRSICPVVAITACRDSSVNSLARTIGISKVLYKPVDRLVLKDTINTFYYKDRTSDAN